MGELLSSGPSGEDMSVPVGLALARLRRRRGWTGTQLAQVVGISQAKVSKIETGAIAVTPEDVQRLAQALDAPPEVVLRLVQEAENAVNQMTDWRLGGGTLAGGQREVARVEAETKVLHVFQNAAIGGLLQTTEYARAILTGLQRERPEVGAVKASGVSEAVSARVKRQEVLVEPSRQFVFLMLETVLQHLVCPPVHMPAQIERIRQVARQPNVTVAIVPNAAQLVQPPLNGFTLFDDRLVLIDLFNTFISSHGRADVGFYRRVFDALEEQATADIDPILDRYLDLYLDRARNRRA